MCTRFLVDMRCIDVLMQVIETPNAALFRCAVLALSHQAQSLQLTSACQDSAASSPLDSVAECSGDHDLVFLLDDGSRVHASRHIMSLSSDVFAAMLRGSFRESTEAEIRIPAAVPDAFRMMVSWLHHQTVTSELKDGSGCSLGLDELCQLIPLFHRFQIPDAVRRRALQAPLIAAVFDGDELEFARVYRLLSVYDDVGGLRRDYVVSVLVRQMSLRRRCAAIASVMSDEADCDVGEFLSTVTAALLDAID